MNDDLLKDLKIYYDADADLNLLQGKTVSVIGYGSQGRAHALNLQDSGVKVIVGLRKTSPRWKQAEDDGLEVQETAEAAKSGDQVVILTQDHLQSQIWNNDIAPNMEEGQALVVAHGFNLNYGQIIPPDNIDVFIDDLHNRDIKFGCIQSLDRLNSDSYQKVTAAMTNKFSAYLPSSLLTSAN